MKNRKVMVVAAAVVALASCGAHASRRSSREGSPFRPDVHHAETVSECRGTYRGVLPAADCPGIETTLTLRSDGMYDLHMRYLERDGRFDASGAYTVRGDLLTLESSGDGTRYRIEPEALRQLDGNGQPIEGPLAEHYVLHKTSE